VIEVERVSKVYAIPHMRRDTVFHRFLGPGSRTYESFHALRGVSFSVARGEFVGILGRNGSGKSTLLRIVAGIYPPTEGRVRVADAAAPILDLGVGFQGALTVSENAVLYGVLLGLPRARLKAELTDILERAGVARFADARLATLSTGLRARLAFTLATRSDAGVLLIDEALAVGDEAFQERCLQELEALRARGRTALFVTHHPAIAERLCPRALVMEAGILRGDGPAAEMIALYRSLQ
jgi:ABC-type polysaccharide/polyol phosphate transport system ATPase subunit